MMRPPRRPIMPLPPREFFRSDGAYLEAKNQHMQEIEQRREQDKTESALFIIAASCFCLIGLVALCMPLYFTFGWRGPMAIPFIGGLFWVVFHQVRSRL